MPIDNSTRFPKPLSADLRELSEGMAIVIDGDTAPKAIASGQYLFIKNHSTLATGGYHATAAIASGADITSSNVTPDADGIVNGAFSSLSKQLNTIPSVTNNSDGSKTYKFPSGKYIRVGKFTTSTINGNRTINGNYTGALPTSMNAWFTAEQFSTSIPNQICFYFDGDTSSLHVGCSAANDWVTVNWIQWG